MRHRTIAVLVMAVLMLTAGCGGDEYPPDVDTGAPVNRSAETC